MDQGIGCQNDPKYIEDVEEYIRRGKLTGGVSWYMSPYLVPEEYRFKHTAMLTEFGKWAEPYFNEIIGNEIRERILCGKCRKRTPAEWEFGKKFLCTKHLLAAMRKILPSRYARRS